MSPKPAPYLAAIPPPGLCLFPGYFAYQQQALSMKRAKKKSKTGSRTIFFRDAASGNLGEEFMHIESKKKLLLFKDAQKLNLIFTLRKENHDFRPDVLHGHDNSGQEVFRMQVKEHIFSHDEYSQWSLISPAFQSLWYLIVLQ
jgi:hypothetical protein